MTSALAAFGGALPDIRQNLSFGGRLKKIYMLTPKAFKKLIEYGVMTSGRSSTIKEKLNALELVEAEDYSLPNIVRPQLRPQGRSADSAFGEGGTSIKKVYMLTPEAFKTH
jgi:hypothetical protein